MKIVTRQFGEIEFSEDMLIHFPKGMIGFERCRRFLIVNDEDYEPFRWLIAVDEEEIGFPVLNPFLVTKNFDKELPHRLVKRLLNKEQTLDLFCVVTLNGEGGKVTINLKSPIVIDYDEKRGEQMILASDDVPVAHPIS
ncbi:MAG: flagellar assembly protein FliW [Calditrichia bacterium]|nr:flagellar assembly protein FliW [Calditrichota bacterium]MCB0285056.1 flagellar assembly protein FliW [Calditrichota bacterium]MCB9066977.1 flagellar assembly protein FliW [Calditrichia bacterium]